MEKTLFKRMTMSAMALTLTSFSFSIHGALPTRTADSTGGILRPDTGEASAPYLESETVEPSGYFLGGDGCQQFLADSSIGDAFFYDDDPGNITNF
jgi:hypothetical protein